MAMLNNQRVYIEIYGNILKYWLRTGFPSWIDDFDCDNHNPQTEKINQRRFDSSSLLNLRLGTRLENYYVS